MIRFRQIWVSELNDMINDFERIRKKLKI